MRDGTSKRWTSAILCSLASAIAWARSLSPSSRRNRSRPVARRTDRLSGWNGSQLVELRAGVLVLAH